MFNTVSFNLNFCEQKGYLGHGIAQFHMILLKEIKGLCVSDEQLQIPTNLVQSPLHVLYFT